MKKLGGLWSLGIGYVTLSPRRIYFSVEFGSDGRVVSVGEAEWGALR
jgi:hypothetical protein